MAHYFLFPELDTTIYSHPDRSEMNTGHDEILEIVKERGNSDNILYPSRILIKFNNDDIDNIVEGPALGATLKWSLQLTSAEPTNLTNTQNLELYAISQSWDEGTGRFSNLPTSSNGASWIYRNNTTIATKWQTASIGFADEGGNIGGTSGSINSTLITHGGGTWYTGSNFYATQQFLAGASLDTNFDVSDAVNNHYFYNQLGAASNFIPNNGFIIKLPDSVETNVSYSLGNLQYFSNDTHTIHPPKLVAKWDDSSFLTAYTGSGFQSGDLHVSLYRNKEEFNQNDEAVFRVHVRERYPTRTFSTTSNYLKTGYFTTASYYSIRDAYTEQEVIPFDNAYTKMSADSDGMYFKIYMKGLQPERYYRVLFKHVNNEGTTIYDDDYYFKVVR